MPQAAELGEFCLSGCGIQPLCVITAKLIPLCTPSVSLHKYLYIYIHACKYISNHKHSFTFELIHLVRMHRRGKLTPADTHTHISRLERTVIDITHSLALNPYCNLTTICLSQTLTLKLILTLNLKLNQSPRFQNYLKLKLLLKMIEVQDLSLALSLTHTLAQII